MDVSRLRRGELIAALGGILLAAPDKPRKPPGVL
jgi:hypothetical protein